MKTPFDQLLAIVATRHRVSVADILGRSRKAPIAWTRHVAIWLAYRISGAGSIAIAAAFNRDDHGTALNSIRAVDTEMHCNPRKRLEIDVLLRDLSAAGINHSTLIIQPHKRKRPHATRKRIADIIKAQRVEDRQIPPVQGRKRDLPRRRIDSDAEQPVSRLHDQAIGNAGGTRRGPVRANYWRRESPVLASTWQPEPPAPTIPGRWRRRAKRAAIVGAAFDRDRYAFCDAPEVLA